MDFPVHGSYRISLSGRVVIVIPVGPNNLESFQRYIRDFKSIVQGILDGTPWAILLVAVRNVIMSPDSEPLMAEFERWRVEKGLDCVAWSMEHLEEYAPVAKYQWSKIYHSTGSVQNIYFQKTEEAIDWLRSNGYSCRLTDEDREFIRDHQVS